MKWHTVKKLLAALAAAIALITGVAACSASLTAEKLEAHVEVSPVPVGTEETP